MRAEGRGGDALYWAALHQVEKLGASGLLRLARVFGSPGAALSAPPEELVARGRLMPWQARQVKRAAESLDELRSQLAGWGHRGIELVAMGEEGYPRALLDLKSPPPLVYLRGRLIPEDARAVAVVGTREPSPEGEMMAERLARGLAERGFAIVSGLARGIDTAGHRGALTAKAGRTIAVMGCGLCRIYPPENAGLGEAIVERGCLIAEVPPETEVDRRFLLARDRLQAALSLAVIVVQAHRECGSMVTAGHARYCRRLLLGVPWSVPPFSEGWQRLQKMGGLAVHADSDLDWIAEKIAGHCHRSAQEPLL